MTKFALRMLGELVDVQIEHPTGLPVRAGAIVGHIEGLKAISDLYCVVEGTFFGGNSALGGDLEQLSRAPHQTWLFEVDGAPDPCCMNVNAYRELLDTTIDRILAKQKTEETS